MLNYGVILWIQLVRKKHLKKYNNKSQYETISHSKHLQN